MVSESLPNVTGSTGYINGLFNAGLKGTGAIQVKQVSDNTWGGYGTGAGTTISFDASKSSSVYQDSANVRPNSCYTGWYIKY